MTEITDKTSNKSKAELDELSSRFALSPALNAAATIESYSKVFGEQDLNQLMSDLQDQCQIVHNGDLRRLESMLVSQSHALQAIFMNLSRRAMNTESTNNLERYLRLALKAQAQCARSLEILGNIKNPSSFAVVTQANIGHAVQVNNSNQSHTPDEASHAGKKENPSNELLETQNGQRLDTGTTFQTSGINSHVETVEQVIGTPNNSW